MARVIQFNVLNDFIQHNRVQLENHYLTHFHLIGIIERLNQGQFDLFDAFNVEDDGGCSLMCVWITGHLLIYSNEWNDEIIEEFEKHVPMKDFKNFQFMGQRALVLDLLKRSSISYEVMKDRLIYECIETNEVEISQGRMEMAQMEDLPELAQMSFNYHNEEYKGEGGRDLEYMTAVARHGIAQATLFSWLDEEICSIAQIVNPDMPISMIGQLYTKEDQRNKGYACSLLHTLTNHQFENGIEKCGLVSDITNPASNKVFEKVGYRPIYELILCFTGNNKNKE